MNRRTWLRSVLAIGALSVFSSRLPLAAARERTAKEIEEMRKNWRAFLPANTTPPVSSDKLQLSDAEWRKRLNEDAYAVLREEDTEPAGSSPLNAEQRPGVFACAGCGLPLFTSHMKYESGTGWPSFFTTIPDAIETKPDLSFFMLRTEYHCKRCGGHQGHLFDDGPQPTKERWCNNGVALKFLPKT